MARRATEVDKSLTAIIVPSHNIPADLQAATEDDLSPMGDYTEVMTVRQLADVVAYLRTAGGNEQARAFERRVPYRE